MVGDSDVTTHIINNGFAMCTPPDEHPTAFDGIDAAYIAGRAIPGDICRACVVVYNEHPATTRPIEPPDTYYAELEARLGQGPSRTQEYQGDDPAMESMLIALESPPFRPPTPQEIAAELPAPICGCQKSRFAVFVWYNPELQRADWYTTMTVPVRPIPVATHCPFCGDELPRLIRKNLPEGFPSECYYKVELEDDLQD